MNPCTLVNGSSVARDHDPAFSGPAPNAPNAPTCAPQPTTAPAPRTTAIAPPRANVGALSALARDSAAMLNSPAVPPQRLDRRVMTRVNHKILLEFHTSHPQRAAGALPSAPAVCRHAPPPDQNGRRRRACTGDGAPPPPGPRPRESGPPAAARLGVLQAPFSSGAFRSRILGPASPSVASLANRTRLRSTGDRCPLASPGFSALLATQVAPESWQAARRPRDPQTHLQDGEREPLGRAEGPRGAPQARL